MEIFLLNLSLSSQMVWSTCIKFLKTICNRNTVRECKWFWLLSQQWRKRWTVKKIFSIRFTDSSPLITKHDSASTWIKHVSFPWWINQPVSWKFMKSFKSTVLWRKIKSTLICLLKVMANMQECCSLKYISEVTNFSISSYHSSEPVISYNNSWNLLSLTAILKTRLAKNSNLLSNICSLSIWVWWWEDITIMQEDLFNTSDSTFMNS